MFKAKRPTRASRTAVVPEPDQSAAFEPETATVLPVSPILYQPIASNHGAKGPMLREAAAPEVSGDAKPASGYVSILSQRLPEPTSYTGKNIIAFDFKDSLFRERPNEAQLLEFEGHSTHVDCGDPPHLQGGTSSSLTIEAWIKADHRGGDYQHIVSHGQEVSKDRKAEVFLRINKGYFQFGTWDGAGVYGVGNEQTTVRNEDLMTWVHIAGVFDHTTMTYSLYRNGIRIASASSHKAPQTVNNPWYIGAMWAEEAPEGPKKMVRHFKGYIAEVRVWRVARTEEEIRRYMLESLPPSGVGQLGAYWRLQDGSGTNAKDSSGCECDGTIRGAIHWKWMSSPVGELSRLLQRQPKDQARKAFDVAKANGFFDPLVFPRIRGVMDQPERRRAKEAIRDLEFETFNAFYESGHHLILHRNFFGAMEYAFLQNPPLTARPKLMLVEEYRLSSFLGTYGVGRTLKSFSLLPGEKTKLTIRTAARSTTAAKQSQSILDSYSQESASDFERSLNEERTDRVSSSSEVSVEASVEASGSWGFGKASASASMSGSSNSAREQFAKSVSNATAKHASKASANRNVQIDTTTETTVTEEKESEIVRDIENINVGHTLNFVFCQMNQEVISLLHLIDIRIGYTNGIEPLREAALYELPDLLQGILIDDPKERKSVQQRIETEIKKIRNHQGIEVDNFMVPVTDSGDTERYTINRDFASEFTEPATKTKARVPGVIISSQSIVMRTEDVAVDSLVGQGSALDLYSEKLQEEENRRKKIANDTSVLQNQLLDAEVKRNAALLALVEKKDVELLKAFAEATRLTTLGSPTRTVSIWEADSASRATPINSGKARSASAT